MKAQEDVPRAPMQQGQRCVHQQHALEDTEPVRPGLGAQQTDQGRHHVVPHHQQPCDAPGFAIGDRALFHVGLGARDLVMVEVQVPAYPWVDGAWPRQPYQAHHQVVGHALLAKVHAVDQVVFQLVGERGEEGIEQQTHPPGHMTADIERCRAEHAQQGKGQDACAQCVLMQQPGVPLAQAHAFGHHHLADMRRTLLRVQRLGACRSTVHASILL